MPRAFLTAEWRNLVMLNYAVEPALLRPYVPAGTELDSWRGVTYISLVGFLFANTRVLGIPVPGHRTFEEVNLRFYVRRSIGGGERRGVTFIRELVPRAAIAAVARLAYNEPYLSLPMRHRYGAISEDGRPRTIEYSWRGASGWVSIRMAPTGSGSAAVSGALEEFITEHYWGYTRQRDGSTIEYQVFHPAWRVWNGDVSPIAGDLPGLYGAEFARILGTTPSSAFLADGSPVTVYVPARLRD